MTVWAIVFGMLGGIGGISGIAAGIYIVPTYRKLKADAKKVGVETDILLSGKALEMYDRAMGEATAAKTEAAGAREEAAAARRGTQLCRDEVDLLRDHIDGLEDMMRAANLVPPPVPPRLYQIGGNA